ncbi:uncharacterized protein V6R79_009541 [Siganus canaliculatus]
MAAVRRRSQALAWKSPGHRAETRTGFSPRADPTFPEATALTARGGGAVAAERVNLYGENIHVIAAENYRQVVDGEQKTQGEFPASSALFSSANERRFVIDGLGFISVQRVTHGGAGGLIFWTRRRADGEQLL